MSYRTRTAAVGHWLAAVAAVALADDGGSGRYADEVTKMPRVDAVTVVDVVAWK